MTHDKALIEIADKAWQVDHNGKESRVTLIYLVANDIIKEMPGQGYAPRLEKKDRNYFLPSSIQTPSPAPTQRKKRQ